MANNQQSLEELAWAIEMAQGQFTPILAHCNYARLREKMVQELGKIGSVKIPDITLEPTTTQLYSIIRKVQAEAEGEIPGIQVIGLDSIKDIDRFLQEINPVREEFRKNCPFAVVLWVSDRILQRLVRVISDFESWTTRIEFSLSDEELLEEIRQKTEALFTAFLQIGDAEFVPNQVILGSQYLLELESAVRDLSGNLSGDRQELPPELSASLKFVQGRDAYIKDEIEQAIGHYQESLGFWQQINHQERQGIILFHLGLCSQRQAELNRQEKPQYLQAALSYYQQSIDIFDQAKRPDLVAQFIGQTGDMLRRLKDWDNLAKLAVKSQQLHTEYGSPVQLARDYGFLAEVALNQQKFAAAKKLGEQAILILNHPENIQKTSELCRGEIFAKTLYCYPHVQDKITSGSGLDSASALSTNNFSSHLTTPYLLLLARSLRGMGQIKEAIKALETAKQTNPEYYPHLYIDILEELRSIYFAQKEYLTAFNLKRERRSLQQQFRLTAFIGAGRLQSQRYTKVVQLTTENRENVAEEIVASGREKDLQQLWQRLSSTYSKLIVIHGQSGVGKSSLVNAGLIPSLKLKSIGTKDCLPVTLRVYTTNWQAELGKQLADALADRQIILPESPDTLDKIISYLAGKQSENLLTVFIFDQFEEFFFVCQKTAQQQEFFQFLADGLKLPGVKVILSLRTDYLHYLLIGNKLPSLDIINNDILGKNVLYAIDNFSAADAAEIITRLTERSQFQLEPELIAEMVKDLAGSRHELYPSVRPIELQVVGAQMQAENITTLAEYRSKGPKDKLVERYLAAVVQDCGEENKQMAELVLYFLTDQDKRPLKTLTELTSELKITFPDLNGGVNESQASVDALVRQLKLILDIFVKSGLVFEVSDMPINRYQLVHDYLVDLIHRQKIGDDVKELKKERQKRKQAEAKLARIIIVFVILLGFFGVDKWDQAREKKVALETTYTLVKDLGDFIPVKALNHAITLVSNINKHTSPEILTNYSNILEKAREVNLLKGHTQRVSAVAITPDGTKIVSASDDQTIRVWDLAGNELVKLTVTDDKILSVAIAPDGQKIVSGSEKGMIRVWDINGNELKEFSGHSDQVLSLAITSDGQKIVSASRDTRIRVWNFEGQQLSEMTQDPKKGRGINAVAIAPNNSTIVFGGWDNSISTWDFQSKELKKLGEHQAVVTSLAITPDGQKIVSGSYDNTIRVWDFSGKELAVLTGHENAVSSVAIADGKTIISGSFDKTIRLWDLDSKTELAVLKGHEYYINSVAVTSKGSKMVSGSGDKTIRVWDINKIGESESDAKFPNKLSDVKGQDEFLMIACDRLRLHPVFVEAEPLNHNQKKADDPLTVCRDKWDDSQKAEFDTQKARFYIQEGLKIARQTGDLMQANSKFDKARQLAPKFYDSLKDKPEEKAKLLAFQFFVEEGEKLAEEGKVAEAIATFKQVESLNLSLDFDPEERAKEIAVPSLIAKAANLMRENNPSEGFAKYQQALALDPELTMTQGWDVNQLCWYGSLHGYGAEMMIVCDRAVEWVYYGFDSRGVARAMTGDYAGAIEDFQAFMDILNDLIQNTEGGGISQSLKVRKAQREAWIDALATGQNPFTEELVQELLKQPPFTFSFGR